MPSLLTFTLHCAEDPKVSHLEGTQTPHPSYEQPHNRKIVLCFTKSDQRADWMDVRFCTHAIHVYHSHIRFPQAFTYAMRIPQIMALHAKNQREEASSEAEVAPSPKEQDVPPPPPEEAPKIESISLDAASSDSGAHTVVTDAAPTSTSAPEQPTLSIPSVAESTHDAPPSSSVEAVSEASLGGSEASYGELAAADAFPIQGNVEDHSAASDLQHSLHEAQVVQLSADVEVCPIINSSFHFSLMSLQDVVADEAYDSDAEVEQIVAEVKSGKRVSSLSLLYAPPSFAMFKFTQPHPVSTPTLIRPERTSRSWKLPLLLQRLEVLLMSVLRQTFGKCASRLLWLLAKKQFVITTRSFFCSSCVVSFFLFFILIYCHQVPKFNSQKGLR